jgi:16S rRNA (cytosine1402-N4)-methyltransferase
MDHISVLKNEVTENFGYFCKIKSPIFVDGTIGAAGHGLAIAKELNIANLDFQIIGLDQDKTALKIAKENIKNAGLVNKFILIHTNFSDVNDVLAANNISKIDGALLDLGVSSMQFDLAERGFSFKDPTQNLDMRMDTENELTAIQILNSYPQSRIEQILREFGEEKFSRKIAKEIVEVRKKITIVTVGDLLAILEKAIPIKIQKTGRTHFATKTFQALRIEVNHELEILEQTIDDLVELLNTGGRLAIITFHSLEDRIVKHKFQSLAHPCQCPPKMPCGCGLVPRIEILTKKPIIPDQLEIESNPRSRSAKLRIIEKIK